MGPDFPALAGQSATYLANQLTAWQNGARPPGPMGLMAVIAKKLSEADVREAKDSMYGRVVAGKVLGAIGAPQPFRPPNENRPR